MKKKEHIAVLLRVKFKVYGALFNKFLVEHVQEGACQSREKHPKILKIIEIVTKT